MSEAARLRIAVLASGRGSNFEAIARAVAARSIPADLSVLVTDRPGTGAEAIARARGVETLCLDAREHPGRDAHEKAIVSALEQRQVGLVCLAGYLRLLGSAFVGHYRARMLNIHPSLLPAFPGLHPQRQALAHGVRVTGATVHFVDEGTDTGPIVIQAAVPVRGDDTEETLSARILAEEHRIYPEAVRLFAEGRLAIDGRRVHIRE